MSQYSITKTQTVPPHSDVDMKRIIGSLNLLHFSRKCTVKTGLCTFSFSPCTLNSLQYSVKYCQVIILLLKLPDKKVTTAHLLAELLCIHSLLLLLLLLSLHLLCHFINTALHVYRLYLRIHRHDLVVYTDMFPNAAVHTYGL